MEAGADGIETDLRLTKDGQIVLFHDADLKHFGQSRMRVETLTLSELRSYDMGEGESIVTLDELLALSQGKIMLILEIKYDSETYQKLCEMLIPKIIDKLAWVEVSCFEDKVLECLHIAEASIRLHKLIKEVSVLEDPDLLTKYDFISYFDIAVSLRKKVWELGLIEQYKIIFWTVDKEDLSTEKNAGLYGMMVNMIS